MREILFRGKQEYKNKEWVFGSLHSEYGETDKNGQRKIDYRILGMRGECDYVLSETVGQFTGLTDKNGKKIFEGDIVRCKRTMCDEKEMVGHIVYDDCCFSVKDNKTPNQPAMDLCDYFEVIGNIHDNPELIGGKGNA